MFAPRRMLGRRNWAAWPKSPAPKSKCDAQRYNVSLSPIAARAGYARGPIRVLHSVGGSATLDFGPPVVHPCPPRAPKYQRSAAANQV